MWEIVGLMLCFHLELPKTDAQMKFLAVIHLKKIFGANDSDSTVGNTRQQAVIIHGHSVKWIERVVCVIRTWTSCQGIWTSMKRRNAIWCQPESAIFCTHLSHFKYDVHLLPKRGFFYRACDEEMLTLLKIISWYQWYISLSILLPATFLMLCEPYLQQGMSCCCCWYHFLHLCRLLLQLGFFLFVSAIPRKQDRRLGRRQQDTNHNLVSARISYIFVHIFLILVCCTIVTRKWLFVQDMWWKYAGLIAHSQAFEDYQFRYQLLYQFYKQLHWIYHPIKS